MVCKYFVRVLVVITLALGLRHSVHSQEELDSLKSLLDNATGIEQVELLNQIGQKTAMIDPLKALEYAQLAHKEAIRSSYIKGEVISLKLIGNLYAIRSQLDTALLIIRQSMDKAIEFELKTEVPSIAVGLGGLYIRKYQYKDAFEVMNASLSFARENGQKDIEISILMNIAIARDGLGELNEAESILQEALKISLSENNQLRTGQVYGNLGNLEYKRGNYAIAREHHESGLLIFKKLGLTQMIAISQINLGKIYIELKQYETSVAYLDSVIAIGKSQNDQRSLISAIRHKIKALFELRRFDEVQRELNKIIPVAREGGDYIILRDLFETGYKLAEVNKDPEGALDFYKQYTLSKDSLEARTNRREMGKLTAQFDNNELRNLADKEAQNAEITHLKLSRRNLVIIGLVVVIILIILVFWLNRNRLKHGLELSESKQRLLERELELNTLKISSQQEEISSYQYALDKRSTEASSNEDLFKIIDVSPLSPKDWMRFKLSFEERFPDFFMSLNAKSLSPNDQRLASLIKLGLSTKEIASTLAITPKSVNKAKSRLTLKLEMESVPELESTLQSL